MLDKQVSKRYIDIDILRAIAIIGVMVTHSLALFLGTNTVNLIWNYLHFVVVGFVSCSGYIIGRQYLLENRGFTFSWFKKRFFRLYIPYLVYLLSFLLSAYIYTTFFHGKSTSLSLSFLFKSILLIGGADIGWLTLLFLQLTILTPLLLFITQKNKVYFITLMLIGIFCLYNTFYPLSSIYSRMIAWLPWSFIYLLGMGLAKLDFIHTNFSKKLYLLSFTSAIIWVILRYILISHGSNLTFTLHKYPPDLFYLSYGIGINSFLIWLIRKLSSINQRTINIVNFLSKNSYSMFLLQLIILNVLTVVFKTNTPIIMTIASIAVTVGLIWIWNLFKPKVSVLFS
jgi:peptidoglycan/LPS O-acetylase OafA/YrhL